MSSWRWFLALILVAGSARAQWEILPSGTTADLRGIHSVGNGVAWASGTEGTVLRTVDDGKSWTRCATPPGAEGLDFRGVQAFDAETAIVMSSGKGDLSRLYKTVDGCKSWKLVFTNPDADGFWDAVIAVKDEEASEILLIGDPVGGHFATFQSMYGGTELKKFDEENPVAAKGETLFAASNSSMDVNIDRLTTAFGTGGISGARVIVSCPPCRTDATWIAKSLPGFASGASAGVFSVKNHALIWLLVGGDYEKPDTSNGTAAYSLDDAATWRLSITPPHGYRSAVAYDEASETWITVGPNGTDVSTDDGRNWRALRPDAVAGDAADADRNWNALSLPFVVGPKGRIGKLRAGALNATAAQHIQQGAKP